MSRNWNKSKVGKLTVRVAVGEENDSYADFEVCDLQQNGPGGPLTSSKIATGFIRFDGCVNADLKREDGVMQHWCEQADIEEFGQALVEARKVASEIIPGWCG